MIEIYDYDGLLTFEPISRKRQRDVCKSFRKAGLDVDVGPTYLEFTYSGRDSGRFVVGVLAQVASLLEDAEGEVVCQPNLENADIYFEFYKISGGQLFREYGHLVRQGTERIDLENE